MIIIMYAMYNGIRELKKISTVICLGKKRMPLFNGQRYF
jgi:hypothetical protein